MRIARWAARAVALFGGLFLAGNTVWGATTTNFNLGLVLEGLLALACLGYALVRPLSGSRWVNLVAGAGVVGLASATTWLAITGTHDTATGDEDVVVVLGAAVQGRSVSPVFAARLDVAAQFHRHNPQAFIVVTGGQGPQEEIAEAVAGREYLLARGVADDRIVVEAASTSTAENFAFARQLLGTPGKLRWAYVTNDFHVWRAGQIAAHGGIDATALHAETLWYVRPACYLRELAAIAGFLLARVA